MDDVRVYLVPVSFGFGPAALATAVARQLRMQRPDLRLIGVGDGIALEFLRGSGLFDRALEAARPGTLPESLGSDGPAVGVFFADFDRLDVARARGLRTVVVDPLYWMWDRDPVEPAAADLYLAPTFPGVPERVAQRGRSGRSVRPVPQIVDLALPAPTTRRAGTIVNLGGAVAPMGGNYRYLRALVETVAQTVDEPSDLLVTCSAAAAARIGAAGVTVAELRFDEMMAALSTRACLLTLPGQSIMWEVLQLRVPTVVLPGANYSQHRQVEAYRQFIAGIRFITWDDLDGYGTLPPGLPEDEGVARAVALGDRLAADQGARASLASRLAQVLSDGPIAAPSLRHGHPWSSFDGAEVVAHEILSLATGAE